MLYRISHVTYSLFILIITFLSIPTSGMGHCGELARSQGMTEKTADKEGKLHYDIGKQFMTKEVEKYDEEKKEHYVELVPILPKIKEHFLTPKPVLYATPSSTRQVVSIGCGGYHLMVVTREVGSFQTTVFSSGLNNYGQLGLGDLENNRHELTPITALDGKQIISVDGGNHHSIAMDIHRQKIYAWGRSDYGQLGIPPADPNESGSSVSTPMPVALPKTFDPATERLEEISTGELCSFATTTAGKVFTWGFNEVKQTGHKTSKDVHRPRLLAPLDRGSKRFKTKTHQISGGSQHSLIVATKFLA